MTKLLEVLGSAVAAILLLAVFGSGAALLVIGGVLSGNSLIQAGFYGLEAHSALGQLLLGVLGMFCGAIVCLCGSFIVSFVQASEKEKKFYNP